MDFGLGVFIQQEQQLREDAVRPGVAVVDVERGLDLAKRLVQDCGGGRFEKHVADHGPGDVDMGAGILRVERNGIPEMLPGFRHALHGQLTPPLVPQQNQIVGGDARGRLAPGDLAAGVFQPAGKGCDDCPHDLVLQRKDVFEFAVVALGPEIVAARGVEKLDGRSYPAAHLAHASLRHVADTELAADPFDLGRLALVGEAGMAGDDEQRPESRQLGDDVPCDPIRKIVLPGITAQVGERKHRKRRPVGDGRCG